MSTMISCISKCRVCKSTNLTEVLNFGNQYISNFVTESMVSCSPKCPIEILLCNKCTLLQQRYTVDSESLYSNNYWYKSSTTSSMKESLRNVVYSVADMVKLEKNDIVLDIGSNDGTLLRFYNELYPEMKLKTYGVEPAENLAGKGSIGISQLIRRYWSINNYLDVLGVGIKNKKSYKAKIITACGMLYDLETPIQFLKDVSIALHDDGVFIAQFVGLYGTVKNLDVGNFAHEHIEFYSIKSLIYMLDLCDLVIVNAEENNVNGLSDRYYIKHKSSVNPQHQVKYQIHREKHLDSKEYYTNMFKEMEDNKKQLQKFIQKQNKLEKYVYGYGASTKGNVMIQYYELNSDLIKAIVEKDSEKFGLFTPGSGIPIIDQDKQIKDIPYYMLVFPYAFINEFVENEKYSYWRTDKGKFIVPLPKFHLV